MSSEALAIRAENLGKCYAIYRRPQDRLLQMLSFGTRRLASEHWALREVSFEVARGQTLGIIGRNGSGKSTLLQLVAGTLAPTTGTARVAGRVAALLELGAGFNPEYSGVENVYLNAALLGLSRRQTEQRFDAIAAYADIGDYLQQPVKTYSSGMVVRLAFAVAAHVDAEVLIIDEALAVGDAYFAQKCMRTLERFRADGGVILFVSHDAASVLTLCERVLLLEQGRVRYDGAAKAGLDLYLKSLFQRAADTPAPMLADASTQHTADAPSAHVFPKPRLDDAWGDDGARIVDVRLADARGAPLSLAEREQPVRLLLSIVALRPLEQPVVGFLIRNALGLQICGANSLDVADPQEAARLPRSVAAQARFDYWFDFTLPALAPGDYSVSVAVGEGTRDAPVILHWVHDALVFSSGARVFHGVVGLSGLRQAAGDSLGATAAGESPLPSA